MNHKNTSNSKTPLKMTLRLLILFKTNRNYHLIMKIITHKKEKKEKITLIGKKKINLNIKVMTNLKKMRMNKIKNKMQNKICHKIKN